MLYQISKICYNDANPVWVDSGTIKGIDVNSRMAISIPKDDKNPKYRRYLQWLDSGKTALPFDLDIHEKDENGDYVHSDQDLIDMTNQGSL